MRRVVLTLRQLLIKVLGALRCPFHIHCLADDFELLLINKLCFFVFKGPIKPPHHLVYLLHAPTY